MIDNQELYDITIIGGGTAGLYAAYYAGMREMKTKVIESLPYLGGTVAVFYPEKNIYDIGGIPKISGSRLIEQLTEQALLFQPKIVLEQDITRIETNDNGTWTLSGSEGEPHYSKTVLIAAGPGRIKKLNDQEKYQCDVSPVKEWGFTLKERRIPVNQNMETGKKGIYVAGDMAGYPNKWRLIASAFNEVITAVNYAKYAIDPSAIRQVYSSVLMD